MAINHSSTDNHSSHNGKHSKAIVKRKKLVAPPPSSNGKPKLLEEHRKELRDGSGLTDDTIAKAGIYTESSTIKLRKSLCILPEDTFQPSAPALAFPYYGFDGFIRYRFFGDSVPKYCSPFRQGNRPYLIPGDDYEQPLINIWITEGEKKALKLWQELRNRKDRDLVIGLGGVCNFAKTGSHMLELLPYLDAISWSGRNVYICFDNDIHWNNNVQLAREKLADLLICKGAEVYGPEIPIYDKSTKVGLDDFMMMPNGVERFFDVVAKCDTPLAKQRYRCEYVTGADVFKIKSIKYIIEKILHNAPLAIGGPKKSMKTHAALDMATSLASGKDFLDAFKTREPKRVFYCYGESCDLQHLLPAYESVLHGKQLTGQKKTLPLAFSSFMPRLDNPSSVRALQIELKDFGAEVVFVDPMYRCFGDIETANAIDTGSHLVDFFNAMLEIGVIPIICHHFKKNVQTGVVPELDMFAYTGVAESVRSWLLLNHRTKFNPKTLTGELYLVSGGSGYSTLKQVRMQTEYLNYQVALFNAEPATIVDDNSEYKKHLATLMEFFASDSKIDASFWHLRTKVLKSQVNPSTLCKLLDDMRAQHLIDFVSPDGNCNIYESTKGITFRPKPTI